MVMFILYYLYSNITGMETSDGNEVTRRIVDGDICGHASIIVCTAAFIKLPAPEKTKTARIAIIFIVLISLFFTSLLLIEYSHMYRCLSLLLSGPSDRSQLLY